MQFEMRRWRCEFEPAIVVHFCSGILRTALYCTFQVSKSYGSTRDALLLSGKFVLSQLAAMTAQHGSTTAAGKSTVSFLGSAFGVGLAAEVSAKRERE